MHHVYVNDFDTVRNIYTDLHGHFSILFNSNNHYLFILYEYDSNELFSDSIKIDSVSEMVGAYTKTVNHLNERVFKPKL